MRAAPSGAVFLIAVELFESKAVSLLFASIFGNLSRSYLFGAVNGWGKIQSVARQQGINIGTFSLLRDINLNDRKAVVELPNLKALEETLKMVGPTALRDFKRNARKIGNPAKNKLRDAFRSAGFAGPLGFPTRKGRNYDKMMTSRENGRLSYQNSFTIANSSRGIDVNYKNRREGKALRDMAAAKDGTISIVRLMVKAPAFIVADMAGKTGSARIKSGPIREYKTNLFGRGTIQATPQMREMTPNRYRARTKWLQMLDKKAHRRRQSSASRYAWPTMERYMPKHKANASVLFNETIAELNRKLGK